ncbi:hypothetical protein [Pandoraea pnomenusa]|uniref:hypothetical protein n=1 Tax=Pandoraea pnomenusa TaxID=93220 RepID=UPI00333F2421
MNSEEAKLVALVATGMLEAPLRKSLNEGRIYINFDGAKGSLARCRTTTETPMVFFARSRIAVTAIQERHPAESIWIDAT